jgi:hypothetical protein
MRATGLDTPPPASETDRAELLRSLAKLVRGLSTLFWCLPLGFLAQVETGRTDWFGSLGAWAAAPAVILSAALFFGLTQLRCFQRQERVWQNSLTRAEALALINTALTPFIYWWHRFPAVAYFLLTVGLLALSNLLFLMQLNRVLHRLTAMIPEETLRAETALFASFNIWLLAAVFLILSAWFGAWSWAGTEAHRHDFLNMLRWRGLGAVLFLTLVPLALTMALIWKIKEVLYAGIFSHANE